MYTTLKQYGHGQVSVAFNEIAENQRADFNEDGLHLPTPSMIPLTLMEPSSESNIEAHNRHGHYFDPKFYHHHQPQHPKCQSFQPYPQQRVPSSHGYDDAPLQPYTPHSNMPSPLSSYSPIESFHFAHASPILHYREYESQQSSPVELAAHYRRAQEVFPDLNMVDGNEVQDEYMAEIFLKVFEKQGGTVFRPGFLCMDRAASNKEREDLVRQIAYHPGPVCTMQPHRGKRSAMYTGFAALLQQGIDAVVVTDSDTFLDPGVCKELAFALAESPIVGATTGDVRIYNTGTWVSFLSSIRYWFAFNLERGAQSYHSVVNCVSGPLGIYRMSIVADVMDSWLWQSFLGVLCTYGDDRHLTNLVLREGYKVKFSHYTICYTDTPIRLISWVTQQTRWSKSFFREIPIQLGCIHLHSPWMTYALLYQLIYPMMMVYSLVNCIYFGTGSQISWWMVSITLVGMVKTSYAVWITGDKKFFFTTAYGFLYMLGYVPAKIYAALTLYDSSWGTSARLFRNFTQLQNYIAPTTWGTILLLGILQNPARYYQHAPLAEGKAPPLFSDETVVGTLVVFSLAYLSSYLWFFVRTGAITRDYKRDFSYEELYEDMINYVLEDGKRKFARFEV
ncbi:MAG: nucleotide-diphospho-sugar transferase [Benniella sp.]|nr:MAG: nucleotide-diphospho-sugar transferase [Benniella sp.]